MSVPSTRDAGARSFRSILKTSSMVGGASVLNVLIGMVRTKFVAVLIGPAGVGLLGGYAQVAALVSSISGMGVDTSGVRQVAEAVATADEARVARTVIALRRTAWVTGALGMVALAALALPIARVTFADKRHAWPIVLVSLTILLNSIAAGQSSLLRGTRRIAEGARVSVLVAVGATLVSLPCYALWGTRGVAPALVLSSAVGLAVTWLHARRVPVLDVRSAWGESRALARSLLALGASFMVAGLVLNASISAIQTILIRRFGVLGLGLYQAAFGLSGVLVNFVLGAMAADYYPRLSSAADDDPATREMLNEQSQVSTLLAGPGIALMLVFAPLVVRAFYAPTFAEAVPLLRWCALGVLGRVLSWPLGFILLARGKGRLFLVTETGAAALHVGLVAVLTPALGLRGAAIAFVLLYVGYTLTMIALIGRLVGGAWSRATLRINTINAGVLAVIAANAGLNPEPAVRWVIGVVLAAALCVANVHQLLRRSGLGWRQILDLRLRVGGRTREPTSAD